MKKKIFALLLAVLMLVPFVVACGGDTNTDTGANTETNTNTGSTNTDSDKPTDTSTPSTDTSTGGKPAVDRYQKRRLTRAF